MNRRRLKICRVQSRICTGGPAQHTFLLATRLDRERYETVLIGGGLEPGEQDMAMRARDQGVRTVIVPEMRRRINPAGDLQAFGRLCRIFRKERPDIVHTHTAKAGALGRLAARACGVPVVVHTFHGHVLTSYYSRSVSGIFAAVERGLGRLTDRIIVLSEGQKRELAFDHRVAPIQKLQVIPLGLDLERFLDDGPRRSRRRLRAELGIPDSAALIGWVGRLAEVKDPSLFLRACARLSSGSDSRRARPGPGSHPLPSVAGADRASARPPAGRRAADRDPGGDGTPHFLIVGDGHLRPGLETEARALGIAERTHFLGYRDDTERIYAALDLFVLTSRNEGTPVAMIEAMAAGLAVVAPAVGGIPDVARGYPCAEIVRDAGAASIADAMRRSLGRARDRGRVDGRPVVRRYGVERLVRDIETLYDEILSERGVRGVRGVRGRGTVRKDRAAA